MKKLSARLAVLTSALLCLALLPACDGDSDSDNKNNNGNSGNNGSSNNGNSSSNGNSNNGDNAENMAVHSVVHISPFADSSTVQDATLVVENNTDQQYFIYFDNQKIGVVMPQQTVIADIFHGTHTITVGPVTETLLIPSGKTGTVTVN